MKFRAKIQNFMGIGNAELDLADKGLVAVQGVNNDDTSQDSNGAGKSSLVDAICWALWGETARDGLGADEVVNTTAKKDTEVEVVATEDDGGFYTIKRWRKKSGAPKKNGVSITYTDKDGNEVDKTGGTDKLTQVEIEKALGCTKEVFVAAVYAGQEKLPNLPAMTDNQLKQLIEKASGVDVLVEAYRIARDKLKEAQNAHDIWRADHVRLEREVQTASERVQKFSDERDSYETKRKDKLAILATSVRQHVENANRLKIERDSVDPDRMKTEIAALDKKIDGTETERVEEDRLADEERSASSHLTTLTAHYNRAVKDAHDQKANIANIASRVGQPCSECGKPCEEHDIGEVKARATEVLKNLVARAKEIGSDLEAQKKVVTERAQKLAEYRSKKTDIRAVVEERKRFAEALAKRARTEDHLAHELTQAHRVKAEIDALKAEVNPFVSLTETAKAELEDAAERLHESEEKGVALDKRIAVCKSVVQVYGPSGVRAHVLDTVTPFLNDRTAEYISTLSDGNITAVWSTLSVNAKGDLVENFAIDVKKSGAGSSFAALSGGEKRKVRLACALALQDLVASRATKPIELAIYDEIDDAMDDAGLERLFTILEGKGRDRGTLVIISHNAITDFVRQTTTVTMKGGFSTISGVLSAA